MCKWKIGIYIRIDTVWVSLFFYLEFKKNKTEMTDMDKIFVLFSYIYDVFK